MKSYNGFTATERMRGYNWLKEQIARGTRTRAKQCDCCGQTRGILELHSEDYSEPHGDHIGAYELCYVCHMVIHCRDSNPAAWERYKAMIRAGLRVRPFRTRDFQAFCVAVLRGPTRPELQEPANDADPAVFDAIEAAQPFPRQQGTRRAAAR